MVGEIINVIIFVDFLVENNIKNQVSLFRDTNVILDDKKIDDVDKVRNPMAVC